MIYRHDYAAFGREVLNAPFMVAEMAARGGRVLAAAEASAPYYAPDRDGSHYRDSFHLVTGTHGGLHHDRAYAEVSNDNSAAVMVEFGFGPGVDKNGKPYPEQVGHRTLGRALDAAR